MKGYAFRFRRLAPFERAGRHCRMRQLREDEAPGVCGRPATVEFRSVRSSSWKEIATILDYCETHGAAVARMYGARIEASDETPQTETAMIKAAAETEVGNE